MSDRKPIFVIQLANTHPEVAMRLNDHLITKGVQDDYHVIIILGNENKFQMFSDKEIEPIQLDELKELLKQ